MIYSVKVMMLIVQEIQTIRKQPHKMCLFCMMQFYWITEQVCCALAMEMSRKCSATDLFALAISDQTNYCVIKLIKELKSSQISQS